MSYHDKILFEEQLRNQIGEFIIVLIKSGRDCCKHKGVLCGVKEDFIILINNNFRIEIPLDAIVAIQKKIVGVEKTKECDSCSTNYYK